MISKRSLLALGFGLGLAAIACGGSVGNGDLNASSSGSSGTTETTPQEVVTVSPPSTGLEVTATIIAATLGDDDCGASGAPLAGDCAPEPGEKGCGPLPCRESNLQLSFTTGAGKSAKVEITSVTLHDAKTGKKVDSLQASSPQSWTGSTYATWDQTLEPSSTLKASYDLSAPSWSSIGSGDGWNTYSASYKLRVALKIDGVSVVLESAELSREPAVAT